MTDPRVVIGCATNRPWEPRAVFSFAQLVLEGPVVALVGQSDYIDLARNAVVKNALAVPDATHLLFIDDDHLWPSHTLDLLLAHDCFIVGGLYFRREPPYDAVPFDDAGKPLETWQPGLQRVDGLGMGCALINLNVFRMLDEAGVQNGEYFLRGPWGGEDVYFCRLCREAGIGIFLDAELIVTHLGVNEVTEETWRRERKRAST